MESPLLDVRDLRTYFNTEAGVLRAVDRSSFQVGYGERVGIVGESGSGKSVTALSIMRLVAQPAGEIMDGSEILFKGKDLVQLGNKELQRIRGKEIGMVFQDPLSSLNPVYTIGNQIEEALKLHSELDKAERYAYSIDLLGQMGIPDPKGAVRSYPHELSGGMRQRVMIAMAISCNPDLLIADEPTTALDMTIQAQIMELLMKLSEERGIAVILITHDLGIVAGFAERILVMYAGRVIECGTTDEIFYDAQHPYTMALLKSIPRMDLDPTDRLPSISGAPPSLVSRPTGCTFHPRCEFCQDRCKTLEPQLTSHGLTPHSAACHRSEELDELGAAGVAVPTTVAGV
jgi:oligopeptide/dipeptide ABC transporter ATP-binding protein